MASLSAASNRSRLPVELAQAVSNRFPVLQHLEFSDVPTSEPALLPNFIGLMATILEVADRPCCIVLPDSRGVAIAVSTVIAVSRLRNEFPDILRLHASTSFTENANVLVHPSELVYRYEGFFTPTLFRLGVIDRRDSRSLPVQEIARLEKTTRKRPKGYLNSDLGQSRRTILGSLLGTAIPLNRNFLRNYILVLGPRKPFVEELDRWTLQIPGEQALKRDLKDEVAFGKVVEGGTLHFLDGYVASGEPLIAVASGTEDLVAYCERAPRFTKAIIVDDIDQFIRDPRAYDALSGNQRMLILASDSDREAILAIEDRGCEIWRLTPDEMLLGLEQRRPETPFRNLTQKGFNMRDSVISTSACGEPNLTQAAEQLKDASRPVSSSDNGTIRELLFATFRTLLFCAEYLGQDSGRFVSSAEKFLQVAGHHLQNAKVWLPQEAHIQFKAALENIQLAVVNLSQSDVTPKGQILLDSLARSRDQNNRTAAVVSRSETDCRELKDWLAVFGFTTDVYLVGELPHDQYFDQVLVVSWPRSARFDRLVHQYVTDDLRLLAYPFEEIWLSQYQKHYKRSYLSGISTNRKVQLLGLASADSTVNLEEVEPADSGNGLVKFDVPEEQFLTRRKMATVGEVMLGEQEEFVDACYVDFVGPTFAYLMENHALPVLNTYISKEPITSGSVPLRAVAHLKVGDYVAFRESGDSDIIRFLAEDEIGKDSYRQLRSTAGRWRTALWSLSNDPKVVWHQLTKVGLSRRFETVRAWMVDESRISPQDIDDVRKIAEAAEDNELISLLPELQRAKDRLMSLHIGAGSRLTELLLKEMPKKLNLLTHGETELDLGVGKVWIVHIQEIDHTSSPQRRSQVNRLLWDEASI